MEVRRDLLKRQLQAAGRILVTRVSATKMNGHPRSVDHAAPARLVVPGRYGCGYIKWMNEIIVVAEDAAATSQMQEHTGRTMQKGSASPCQAYQVATIDPAAAHSRGKVVRRWENQIPCGRNPVGRLPTWQGSENTIQPGRGVCPL